MHSSSEKFFREFHCGMNVETPGRESELSAYRSQDSIRKNPRKMSDSSWLRCRKLKFRENTVA